MRYRLNKRIACNFCAVLTATVFCSSVLAHASSDQFNDHLAEDDLWVMHATTNKNGKKEARAARRKQLEQLEKETGLKGKDLKRHIALLQEAPPLDNDKVQAYVTEVGERILAQSEHAHLPYRFIVRDSEVPNAFVTGTHYVYVERGLLSLLNSEAELAAVMAHEIGHNVARHVKKAQARNRRNIFLANLASIAVMNSSVGGAIMTQSNVKMFEYQRAAELEADSFAAKYLYGAKYEPSKLVNALSQLHDYNVFAASNNTGALPHHGLTTSHPRTDKRLRAAIEDAGVLPPGEGHIGRERHREAIEGMIFGPNYARNAPDGLKRYTNEQLGITFLYPDDWSFDLKGSKIILKDPAKTAQLKITIEKTPDTKASSEQALRTKYPDGLVDVQKIHPESQRDLGSIGARPAQRVALSMVARNTFHFLGIARDNQITAEQDANFVNIIRSFRRMTPKDRVSDTVTKIYYERLEPGETLASLAKDIDTDDPVMAELQLRVLNGYFPKGEPEPGMWIKKLRQEKIER